jgi:hypothetical protein
MASSTKHLVQRVAFRYLKQAFKDEIKWGIEQLKNVLETLGDVVDIWSLPRPGEESPSDVYREVAHAATTIKSFSRELENHVRNVARIKAAAAKASILDRSRKTKINRVFALEGLDGNGRFEKAERGMSKALEVLGDYGIEMDELPNSHVFTQPSGRITLDLAFTNKEDSFSPIQISNSRLVLTFHKFEETGKYEVTAYVS